MILYGGDPAVTPSSALLLFAAFYGVHRVLRTAASRALIVLPGLFWFFGNLRSFLPGSVAYEMASASPLLAHAPENLAAIVLLAALLGMVIAGRARLGRGLSTASVVVLAVVLLFRLLPTGQLQRESGTFPMLVLATEDRWGKVGDLVGALAMVLVGVGPVAVPPLPRRGGAIAGATGALLSCAGIGGLPHEFSGGQGGAELVYLLLWLVAGVLMAIGLGAMARAGARGAGWAGVGLTVLGLLGLAPALLVFEKAGASGDGFLMATPFGLAGIGIALLGWTGAPLATARKALGVAFVAAFVGGALAWAVTWLDLAQVVHARDPWGLAHLTTVPLATYGLVAWAALLLYLASPPSMVPATD